MTTAKTDESLPTSQPLRYVVLHHTGFEQPHFDLMLEAELGSERLLTWRTPAWPLREGMRLIRLGPHRRGYLDYQGPVSRGRGEVRRVAQGTCALSWHAGGVYRVKFNEAELGTWDLADLARRAH